MSTKSNILILGLTNKTGLAVARNIHKSGHLVDGIGFNDVAAKYSKYINCYFSLGNPEQSCIDFTAKLISHLIKNQYDALIPVHDAALEICRTNRAELSKYVKILGLNEDEKYKYSIDKSELLKLGEAVGLSIPQGVCVHTYPEYLALDKSKLEFPLVAKPVSSAKIHHDKLLNFSVKICKSEDQLTDFIRENINLTPILIQEFVAGYGIGYNFISKNGEIYSEYIHRRINEFKGVSTYRESISTDNYGLKEKVHTLVKSMKWNGVGMIEFMITPDEHPILMEFNGRFFGSTELSARSGINLPQLFVRLFLFEEEIPKNICLKKSKVRFLHDEVLLFTSYLFKLKIKIYFAWLFDLIRSRFQRNYSIEDSIFKDPKFTFGMYLFDVKRWISKNKSKSRLKKVKLVPLNTKHLQNRQHVAFFCFGNICRSPFAKLAAERISSDFQFTSLGYFPQEDRMSPIHAVRAAEKFDIDLDKHLSTSIFSIDPGLIDLFVIMDKKNFILLVDLGIPESKIFFLSETEINDPYGLGQNTFETTYSTINLEIKRIFNKTDL